MYMRIRMTAVALLIGLTAALGGCGRPPAPAAGAASTGTSVSCAQSAALTTIGQEPSGKPTIAAPPPTEGPRGTAASGTSRSQTAAGSKGTSTTTAPAPAAPSTPGLSASDVRLLGRQFYDAGTGATWFSFTNAGFELIFTGTALRAELTADIESIRDEANRPYLSVYVNDMETPAQIYGMAQKEATLTLFESRTVQTVTIRVLKRSEASVSSIGVRRLTANVGSSLTPTAAPSRRLVFLGDSFTCGFGNEGTPEQPFQTRTENGCDTYAARAARAVGADIQCVCWSGIGVCSSYTETAQPNTAFLMKDLYPKADYAGHRRLFLEQEPYDFSRFQPDAVILHLGTNDSSYTSRAGDGAREAFGRAYDALLSTVREAYPQAAIVCTLGPGTPETRRLYERIRTLVESRRSAGDSRIFDMAFANTLDGEGLGSADHPSMKTHIRMAEELTGQLKAILGWNSPND